MRKWFATLFTIVIIVTVILLVIFGGVNLFDYTTELAVGLTLLLFTLWGWALKPEIKRLTTKEKSDVSTVNTSKRQEATYSGTKYVQPVNSLILPQPKGKSLKNSIYLANENEPQRLNFDNVLLDELYEKALKTASSIYSDSKLSSFHIQVFPYDCCVE